VEVLGIRRGELTDTSLLCNEGAAEKKQKCEQNIYILETPDVEVGRNPE
jgi:hypothetical protein